MKQFTKEEYLNIYNFALAARTNGYEGLNDVIRKASIGMHREEEKPALEVGKWYFQGRLTVLKVGDGDTNVGFDGVTWHEDLYCSDEYWKPADMMKVKELLICEAEKKGFNDFIIHISLDGVLSVLDDDGCNIFNGNTGKWAEIIEKKEYKTPSEALEGRDRIKEL